MTYYDIGAYASKEQYCEIFKKYTNIRLLNEYDYEHSCQNANLYVLSTPIYVKTQLKQHQILLLNKCLDLERKQINLNKSDFNLNIKRHVGKYEIVDSDMSSKDLNVSESYSTWKIEEDEVFDPLREYKDNKSFSLHTRFGCISDDVGSGKTLTALSMINQQIKHNILSKPIKDELSNNLSLDFKISIIVVPHVIVNQWKDNINTQTNLTFLEFRDKDKNFNLNEALNFDILLIKNTEYVKFYKKYQNIIFKRIFFDEADSINIPNCPKLEAMFYWFITANYTNLMRNKNSGKYYWNLLNSEVSGISHNGFIFKLFIHTPKLLKQKLIIRNDKNFIKKSFQIPEYQINIIKCKLNNILKVLEGFVSDDVQRRICAGDIEGAIKSFNIETEDNDNIIQVICKDLYKKVEKNKKKIIETENKDYNDENYKQEALRKIRDKIDNIKESIKSIKKNIEESDLDPITYTEIENPIVMKCCKTVFDFESITMFITNRNSNGLDALCPICRTLISKESMVLKVEKKVIHEEKIKKWIYEEHTKDENIKQIFDTFNYSKDKKKVIIFSQFDASLKKLQFLKSLEIKEIKGNNFIIKKTLDWFKDDKQECNIKILFLNSKYCGAGLNLEMATDIIIYHSMEQNLENQVLGRAQRYPRETQLNVYRFKEI